jgi:hypothetical protein
MTSNNLNSSHGEHATIGSRAPPSLDRRRFIEAMGAGSIVASLPSTKAHAQSTTPSVPVAPEQPQQGISTINVRAFGARGDGVADDTKAIQSAIDHAISTRTPAVHLPAGRYRTTDTLHLGYGFDFVSVSLLGEASFAYGGSMAGTAILPEQIDRPAINIQGGRANVIRGISIVGRNRRHIEQKVSVKSGAGDPDPLGWLDPALPAALRRYAPYAAITIDAYSGPVKSDGYPRPDDPRRPARAAANENRRYSSDIIIDRCYVSGFGVGIAVQPCDADGNGDFVKITNASILYCVYGIAVGNSQSRNVAIRDCTYAGVHTFLTNKHFGRSAGTLGGPIDNLSGGVSYQLLDVAGNMSLPVTISHLYVEAQSRIGVWSVAASFNNTLIFQSCTFGFSETLLGKSVAKLLECGPHTSVRFIACSLVSARRMIHLVTGAASVSLESCMLGNPEEWHKPEDYRAMPAYAAKALAYTCGGVFLQGDPLRREIELTGAFVGPAIEVESGPGLAAPRYRAVAAPVGKRTAVHHYATEIIDRFGRVWPIRERRPRFQFTKNTAGSVLLGIEYSAPDEVSFEFDAQLQQTPASRFEEGDVLHDAGSGTLLAVSRVSTNAKRVRIAATHMNNIELVEGRYRAASRITATGGYVWLHHSNVMVGDAVFFGDFAAGSATVSNVHIGNGSAAGLATCLRTGDLLHFSNSGAPIPGSDRPQPYPTMTSVQSVDETARTVTLDRPAIASARYMISTIALG